MNNLIFACSWDADRSKSWSGTHLALFKALQRCYNVTDFDMNLFHSKRLQILNKILKYKLHINLADHFNSIAEKRYQGVPIFQFGDCPDVGGSSSYPYVDMAWKEVWDLCNRDKQVFTLSNYARFDAEDIKNKYKNQSEFFKKSNCKAIFCMGRWLAKDLSTEHDNVFHAGGGYKY